MKVRFIVQTIYMLIASALLIACVGPTTPFGAIDNYKGVSTSDPSRDVAQARVTSEVNFYPEKQVLHDKTDFTIEVRDDHFIPYDYDVKVFHNSHDVTHNFLKESQVFRSHDGKQLLFTMKDFRLKTLDKNKIKVVFQKDVSSRVEAVYESPQCSLFEKYKLKTLGPFRAPAEYKQLIEVVAKTANYNPHF